MPQTSHDGRRLASREHAATYAGCSVSTINRRTADGTLTVFRLGPRCVRIDLDELDDLMESAGRNSDTGNADVNRHIDELVNSAPPLSNEQRDRLALLLRRTDAGDTAVPAA